MVETIAKFISWNLIVSVTVLRGGDLGRELSHKADALNMITCP